MKEKIIVCHRCDIINNIINEILWECKTENTEELLFIQKYIAEIQQSAQKMEDRLKQYKIAIEKLGFERVKIKE